MDLKQMACGEESACKAMDVVAEKIKKWRASPSALILDHYSRPIEHGDPCWGCNICKAFRAEREKLIVAVEALQWYSEDEYGNKDNRIAREALARIKQMGEGK